MKTILDLSRRKLLEAGAGLAALIAVRPALATPDAMKTAIAGFTGGAPVTSGKVTLEVAQLVDNGNAVPVTVRVDSAMTAADHVTAIAVFNEKNPQPDMVRFTLGPRSGKAVVTTRVRLATSQRLSAVARMSDGSFWSGTADVIVTLAACVEGDS